MSKIYRITLPDEQRQELEKARERHAKPYIRERVAAILKVTAGLSLRQVAYNGLLKRHAPETVKVWCERYLANGLSGLIIQSGRGRKPAFSPSEPGTS